MPRPHLKQSASSRWLAKRTSSPTGSPIELNTTVARIEFLGKIVDGTLVFGDADADAEPLSA